ncbi:hypothetical protein SAY87_030785 [Trapa incisa]|uniref:60S acidic ribosomal protein P1 n=1 Tax=Trapa incisa TaxID=236973 RepID=A0AAN7QME2_9MYRT|nr:hypothetical protein SAY87_030785 [Trapa incisa]
MSMGKVAYSYTTIGDGVPITSYWPRLFAKLAEKRNVDDLIMNAASGGGGAPVAMASTFAVGAVEEKKEEPKEESDDDMGFSLFD